LVSARAHLGLAADDLTELASMRGRIDNWRTFLGSGLDDADRDAIRIAERSGRLSFGPRSRASDSHQ
jgi:hypothetical protein